MTDRRSTRPEAQSLPTVSGGAVELWLWREGENFAAYDTLFPRAASGDPLVLGEPAAKAIYTPLTALSPTVSEADGLAGLLEALAGDCDAGEDNDWESHEWADAAALLRRAALALRTQPSNEAEGWRALLQEARLQLEYLDERSPSGTTPAVIARIDAALNPEGNDHAN